MVIGNFLESLTVGQTALLGIFISIALLIIRCFISIKSIKDEEYKKLKEELQERIEREYMIQRSYMYDKIQREYELYKRINYGNLSETKPTTPKHIVLKYEHCPNCGASMHSNKCEYCDSEF